MILIYKNNNIISEIKLKHFLEIIREKRLVKY